MDCKGRNLLLFSMLDAADSSQVEGLSLFFKTGKGQYEELCESDRTLVYLA